MDAGANQGLRVFLAVVAGLVAISPVVWSRLRAARIDRLGGRELEHALA
jgi:hypothetical protein